MSSLVPTTPLSLVLSDTLANLTAGAPYAAIYRGHYANDTTNDQTYWIDDDGNLQLVNFNVAGYTGFTFTDGTTASSNIASGGVITFADGAGIDVVSGGTTLTVALAGAAGATAGQVPVSDGSGGVAFAAPLTVAAASAPYASINASNELEISQLLITSFTASGAASFAAFIAADYTTGAEFGNGDIVFVTATGETYINNGGTANDATDFTIIGNPAGAIQNFTIAGDTGTANTITDGETFTVAGGTGIDSVVTADTITLNLNAALADLTGVPAVPGVAGDYYLNYDQATDTYTYALTSTLDTSLANTDQTLTGARSVTQAANTLTFAATGGNVIMSAGDLEIDTNGKGLILKSANGTRYRLAVNDIGVLSTATA